MSLPDILWLNSGEIHSPLQDAPARWSCRDGVFSAWVGERLVAYHMLPAKSSLAQALERTQKRWRGYTFTENNDTPAIDLAQPPALALRGTPFQRAIWQALLGIPRGETRTYREIASAIGKPRATRAVGSAVGANPIAVIIPCHRVIRADGALGGYAWGVDAKIRLLQSEGVVIEEVSW